MSFAITLLLAVPAAYAPPWLSGRMGERLGIGISYYLVHRFFHSSFQSSGAISAAGFLVGTNLVYPTFTVPFSIWLLMGFFKSIPKSWKTRPVDGSRLRPFVKL